MRLFYHSDEGKFDPLCAYDKRFLQTITDYLY